MTESDDQGLPLTNPLGLNLAQLAEWAAVVAAFLYGIGWLFFTLLYARFDLSPESVNIGFHYIVVRVGALLASGVVLGYLFLCVYASKFRAEDSGSVWQVRNSTFLVGYFVLQVTVVAVVIFVLDSWRPWEAFSAPLSFFIAIGAIAAGLFFLVLEAGLVLHWSKYKGDSPQILIERPVAMMVVSLLLICVLVGTVVGTARYISDLVYDGKEFSFFGLRLDLVQAVWHDQEVQARLDVGEDACLTLMGIDNGVFSLYDAETNKTIRTSTEAVAIIRAVDGSC